MFLNGDEQWMPKNVRLLILPVIFAGAVLIALDGSTVYPVLGAIENGWGISGESGIWVINCEILFMMIATPVFARLSDIYGRKPVYLICAGLFLAGTIVSAASVSYGMLLLGRAMQGAGASISVLAIAIIGDNFTESRGSVLGVFGVIIGLAYALGPAAAGLLVSFGWRWIFVLNIPVALAVLLLAWMLLPGDYSKKTINGISPASIVSLGIALVAFLMLVNSAGSGTDSTIPGLLAAVMVLALFCFWYLDHRAVVPVLPTKMLSHRNALIAILAAGIGYAAGAGTYFLSMFAISAFGLSDTGAAYLLLGFSVPVLIATVIIGKLLDVIGPKPLMTAGGLIAAAGLVLLSTAETLPVFLVSLILLGLGSTAVTGNVLYFLVLGETGASDRACGQAMLGLTLNMGSLAGAAILGAVLMSGPGEVSQYRSVYFDLAGIYVILAVLALFLENTSVPKQPRENGEQV